MTKKQTKDLCEEADKEKNYIYLDEKVKDFLYSDFVRVNSGPRGVLLALGKGHPESDKFVIFSEVLLPLDVAFRLKDILTKHFDEMTKKGLIRLEQNVEKSGKEKNGH